MSERKPRKTHEEREAEYAANTARYLAEQERIEREQQRRWRIEYIIERVAAFRYNNVTINNGCAMHDYFSSDVTETCALCGCPFCKRVVGHASDCVVLDAETLIREGEKPAEPALGPEVVPFEPKEGEE